MPVLSPTRPPKGVKVQSTVKGRLTKKEEPFVMRPIEIKDLVVGLTTIVLLALALEQLDRLHAVARKEAAKALGKWPERRPFFPSTYHSQSVTGK